MSSRRREVRPWIGLFDKRTARGQAARLVLGLDPGGQGWRSSQQFDAEAFEALREAHRQAARRVVGLPPALKDHAISLRVSGSTSELSGGSLALPAALGFYALWTGQELSDEVAATGRLGPRGVVRAVGGTGLKAAALQAEGVRRVLVPSDCGSVPGLTEVVRDLDQALGLAGLERANVEHRASDREVIRRARHLTELVLSQELRGYVQGGGGDPWRLLGGELLDCVDELKGTARTEARCAAALALAHAGSGEAIFLLGEGIGPDARMELRLLHAITRLAIAIGSAPDAEIDRLFDTLAAVQAATPESEGRPMMGWAWGTLGRARLHQRRFAEAGPLLRKAVEHHRRVHPHELGRSLTYLAILECRSESPRRALQTLGEGRTALREHTLSFDPAYYNQCQLYWYYEAARATLDDRRPDDALVLAELGLGAVAEHQGGAWPAVGLHRTAAWACRELGRPPAPHLRSIQDWVADGAHNPALLRVAEEARGGWRPDGEVY